MQCPVPTLCSCGAICLRARYAVSGTDVAYGAARISGSVSTISTDHVINHQEGTICKRYRAAQVRIPSPLCACDAVSSTDLCTYYAMSAYCAVPEQDPASLSGEIPPPMPGFGTAGAANVPVEGVEFGENGPERNDTLRQP
eukprot:2654858-Rhodomonas_salina.2